MDASRASVDVHLASRNARGLGGSGLSAAAEPMTRCLALIRDLAASGALGPDGEPLAVESFTEGPSGKDTARILPMSLVRDRCRAAGFTDEHIQHCISAFDQCNIWSVSADGLMLKIFN
jgi:hypothetical protein